MASLMSTVRGGRMTCWFYVKAMINVVLTRFIQGKVKTVCVKRTVREASDIVASFLSFICISIVNPFSAGC